MQYRSCYWCRQRFAVPVMHKRVLKCGQEKWCCRQCPKHDRKLSSPVTPYVSETLVPPSTPVGGTLGGYRVLARRLVAVTEADLLPQRGGVS